MRLPSWLSCFVVTLGFLPQIALQYETTYVTGTNAEGKKVNLADSRQPALFTRNFGDCLGSSTVNVTRFDVAYYADNMTVLFHLEGNTLVRNESLMMYIGVFAYGENRFDLTFNPCNANIDSLCPMREGVPIEANGIIPVAQSDVAAIPPIALSIPDFEGQAILRIFANSTETEIGCYSALVTNGATFAHPKTVGTILGLFTLLAIVASFATAIYGEHISVTRRHYAHSLSVFVVFAVLQHIYFTGALSMNWPSVLSAFWSNYAWAGGMIYSQQMQNSINSFLKSNLGNTSSVGAAGSGSPNENLGGGYSISAIYKRAAISSRDLHSNWLKTRSVEGALSMRSLVNSTNGYSWYGSPVKPGMPLPGNFSGFAGTLANESIPASNAFLTGFLWLLIFVALMAFAVISTKWILEGLTAANLMKKDTLSFFRKHWVRFTAMSLLRTLFVAFFMMTFLTLFQSSYKGVVGVTAIAAIVFILFFVGTFVIAGYACFYRLRFGHYQSEPDRLNLVRKKLWGTVPWLGMIRASQIDEKTSAETPMKSLPWWRIYYVDQDPNRVSVHEDDDYTTKFGWLSARFRRTRWWFFAPWLIYEFVRACFYGGAAAHPATQVYGLLVVEIIAAFAFVKLRPFEGSRLNTLMIYMLSASKVVTLILSATLLTRYNLPRILTTVLGVIIIVVQGVLTVCLLIAILVGALTSYMSLTRNQTEFKPKSWQSLRDRYFKHIDQVVADLPPPPPEEPNAPVEPYFNVASVRRLPKIEDEDALSGTNEASLSKISLRDGTGPRSSRANSIGGNSTHTFTTVPWGARVHRASWSTRDFEKFADEHGRPTHTPRGSGTFSSLAGPTAPWASTSSLPRTASPLANDGIKEEPIESLEEHIPATPTARPTSTVSPPGSGSPLARTSSSDDEAHAHNSPQQQTRAT